LTLIVFSILTVSSLTCFAQGSIIKNPSFEEKNDSNPASWEAWSYDSTATTFKLEEGEGHTGKGFVSIDSKKVNDARYKQSIAVEDNKTYKLTCWAKTENVGDKNTGAVISILDYVYSSKDLKGTVDKWQELTMYAKIGQGVSTINVTVGIGGHGNTNTGKAYFDDISVEEVTSVPNGEQIADISMKQQPQQNSTDSSKKSSNSFVIIAIVVLLVVGVIAYIMFLIKKPVKSHKENDEDEYYDDTDNDNFSGDYSEDSDDDDEYR